MKLVRYQIMESVDGPVYSEVDAATGHNGKFFNFINYCVSSDIWSSVWTIAEDIMKEI